MFRNYGDVILKSEKLLKTTLNSSKYRRPQSQYRNIRMLKQLCLSMNKNIQSFKNEKNNKILNQDKN